MGSVMMSGVAPNMTVPSAGIKASDIAVGSIVKLMEDGVATEYLVVNHGKPSGSTLYDDSCDGTWLLRKYIKETRQWHSSNVNDYANSDINAWLNGDFFNLFGSVEQSSIKQVKIPYVNGNGSIGSVDSGANGLATNIFLLSGYEVGFTTSINSKFPVDGAKLDYFESGDDDGGTNRTKRIAYLNGTGISWWSRDSSTGSSGGAWLFGASGSAAAQNCTFSSSGIRPALVLPSNALFDANTIILKGVA